MKLKTGAAANCVNSKPDLKFIEFVAPFFVCKIFHNLLIIVAGRLRVKWNATTKAITEGAELAEDEAVEVEDEVVAPKITIITIMSTKQIIMKAIVAEDDRIPTEATLNKVDHLTGKKGRARR
jgi:hypothetical protein